LASVHYDWGKCAAVRFGGGGGSVKIGKWKVY
jgi:hypothetical protein